MKEFLQKNKKLVIILSIVLGIICIALILNFTLLSLQKVEVDFKNEPIIFTEESTQKIINDASIQKNISIFAVDKKNITSNLEKNNPHLKVVNIETVFPNKIVIHCAEREETYAVRANDRKYFICDAEFKVLYITTEYYASVQNYAILFTGLENLIENTNRVNSGEFLEFSSEDKVLKSIGTSLLKTNKTVAMQKSLISQIEFKSGIYYYTAQNQPYLVFTDHNGFKTEIYAIDTLLSEKFQTMFTTLSSVVYNPKVFFQDEAKDGKTIEEVIASKQENYYLDYVLKILEDLSGGLHIRLEEIGN